MKTTVLLVLLAFNYSGKAEPVAARSKQNTPAGGKRELEEGNVFGKRAPVLATVSPSLSPGIEYADTKQAPPDKSPIQQYEGVPGKISDVLTGQGPFQEAIAGHLYSPISVYQQRVPTQTYEIGPPVPSQLAYSEHRVSIPNFNQLNLPTKQQIPQQIPIFNQKQNFDQPQYQQIQQIQQLLQQIPNNHFLQPLQYNQQPALQPNLQSIPQPSLQPNLQSIPQPALQQNLQPISQPAFQFNNPQQLQFQQIPSAQPNIVFNQNQQNQQSFQINQRDLKGRPNPQFLEKQNIQAYNQKPQNALSYATFIYNPVDSIQQSQIEQQKIQEQRYQQQIQPQQPRPQIQYQLEHPLLGNYNSPISIQHQPQLQRLPIQPQLQNHRFAIQPQLQFNQLQLQPQQYDVPAHTKTYQREAKQEQQFQNILTPLPAPTFPPVQYFGKFAPSILSYQR